MWAEFPDGAKEQNPPQPIATPASVAGQSRVTNYDVLLCSSPLIGPPSNRRRHFPRGAAFVLTNSGNRLILSNHNRGSGSPIEIGDGAKQRERSQSRARKRSSVLNSLLFM